MREHKYRFWLGHTKKMTHGHTLKEINKVIPEFTDDIIPLEYTGLKDKNENEIYEMDLVATEIEFWSWWFYHNPKPTGHDGYSSVPVIAKVELKEGSWVLTPAKFLESFWHERYPKLKKIISGQKTMLYKHPNRHEVIGNIYEHPHLIKKEAK